jgi:hypothetical protein
MKKLIVSAAAILALTTFSFAADLSTESGIDITGKYLGIDIGARSSGMANAVAARSYGPEAIFGNPANTMANPGRNAILVSHNSWLADTFQETAAYVRGFKDIGTFGAAISYFNQGVIEAYKLDSLGNPVKIDDITPYALVVKANWSQLIVKEFMCGANIGYSMESIGDYSSHTLGVDLGIKYMPEEVRGLSFGLAARNIGINFDGYKLYRDLILGAGYKMYIEKEHMLNFGGDIGILYDSSFKISEELKASIGAEYVYNKMYSLRLGYQIDRTNSDGLTGLRAGAGIVYEQFNIDYAFEPYGDMGAAHKISLGMEF